MSTPHHIILRNYRFHGITTINSRGPAAPPLELSIRVDFVTRSLSRSATSTTAGSLDIAVMEDPPSNPWEKSYVSHVPIVLASDNATHIAILDSVDPDLLGTYGPEISSYLFDVIKRVGGSTGDDRFLVQVKICCWVDVLDEDLAIALAEVLEEREWSLSSTESCTECAVCLEEFVEEMVVVKLRCGHIFHRKCAVEWLAEGKNTCPVCRRVIS